MTELIKTAVLFLTTSECFDQYFVNFNFFHGECMKTTISKLLGLVIIAGSVTVKIPQITKIIKSKSGEGISSAGVLLDLTAITSFFLYSYIKNFPFRCLSNEVLCSPEPDSELGICCCRVFKKVSSWGEGLFLAIQTAAVFGLISYYRGLYTKVGVFLLGYPAVVILVVAGLMPMSFLWLMQIFNLPLIIFGKGIQAWSNYKNQSTGQISAVTSWMQFLGSTARVFTSFQETGDLAVILSFVVASILNGIIIFQLIYYAESSIKKAKKEGKSKDKKSD